MNRDEFLENPDVVGFVEWLSKALPTLPVHLKIARSRFVPHAIDCNVNGIEAVQAKYCWGGNWEAVKSRLRMLRTRLRLAVRSGSEARIHEACHAILAWGDVDGASVFLQELLEKERLGKYLKDCRRLLALDRDQRLSELTKDTIQRFDSGMTKIHALFDKTGSPIYDGRVGAASALLYRMYRCESKTAAHESLNFAWGPGHGNQIRNPRLLGLGYNGSPQLSTASGHLWARRQIQLGWIIRAVLERSKLFKTLPRIQDRCHAFEAGLFMMGYDLRSMIPDGFSIALPAKKKYGRRNHKTRTRRQALS
ncbi:hypothetical protein [Pseudomonas promysalinigenes]|uniref:hypothetical protein n=1 Tax=Pseudomonas TaxID=286 RepID=UPI0039174E6B